MSDELVLLMNELNSYGLNPDDTARLIELLSVTIDEQRLQIELLQYKLKELQGGSTRSDD